MKHLTSYLRNYFGFSSTETRGLLLMLLVIVGSIGFQQWMENDEAVGSTTISDYDKLNLLISQLDEIETKKIKEDAQKPTIRSASLTRYAFDPNILSVAGLIELGVPNYLAKRIDKYRTKGGRFYKSEDLLKIYNFPGALYKDLEPYIKIAKTEKTAFKKPKPELDIENRVVAKTEEKILKSAIKFDINKADTLTLMNLKGIGQKLSARIVSYRDKLGGIHSLSQLDDVYHINDLAVASLNSLAFVDSSFNVRKVDINKADFKTILAHPYIDYETTKAIVNHRRIYGDFSSIDQLKEVYQIKEETLVKILPYLDI